MVHRIKGRLQDTGRGGQTVTSGSLLEEAELEHRKNLEDIIRHARWEAEMVKKLGAKWFKIRDSWLIEAWLADAETWKNPRVKEALLKAILAKDKH